MVSFKIKGDLETAKKFLTNLKVYKIFLHKQSTIACINILCMSKVFSGYLSLFVKYRYLLWQLV